MKHEHRIPAKALSFLLALVMLVGCISVGFTAFAVEDSYQALADAMRADGMLGVIPSYKASASPSVKNKLLAEDPHATSAVYVQSAAMWKAMDAFWKVAGSVRSKDVGDIVVGDNGNVYSGWTGENNTARKIAATIAGKLVSGGYMTADEILSRDVFDTFNWFIGGYTAEHALLDEPARGEKPSMLPWTNQVFGSTGYFAVMRTRDEALYAGTQDYTQIPGTLELNKRWEWKHDARYARNTAGNARQYWHVLGAMNTQSNVPGAKGLPFDPAQADTAALKATLADWDGLFTASFRKQDLSGMDTQTLTTRMAGIEDAIAAVKAQKITNTMLYFYGLPTLVDVNRHLNVVKYHLGLAPYRPEVEYFKHPKSAKALAKMSAEALKAELVTANGNLFVLDEVAHNDAEVFSGLMEVNGLNLDAAEGYVGAILQALQIDSGEYYYELRSVGDGDNLKHLLDTYFLTYTPGPPATYPVNKAAFTGVAPAYDYTVADLTKLYHQLVSINAALTGTTAGQDNTSGNYHTDGGIDLLLSGDLPGVPPGAVAVVQTALRGLEIAINDLHPKYTFNFEGTFPDDPPFDSGKQTMSTALQSTIQPMPTVDRPDPAEVLGIEYQDVITSIVDGYPPMGFTLPNAESGLPRTWSPYAPTGLPATWTVTPTGTLPTYTASPPPAPLPYYEAAYEAAFLDALGYADQAAWEAAFVNVALSPPPVDMKCAEHGTHDNTQFADCIADFINDSANADIKLAADEEAEAAAELDEYSSWLTANTAAINIWLAANEDYLNTLSVLYYYENQPYGKALPVDLEAATADHPLGPITDDLDFDAAVGLGDCSILGLGHLPAHEAGHWEDCDAEVQGDYNLWASGTLGTLAKMNNTVYSALLTQLDKMNYLKDLIVRTELWDAYDAQVSTLQSTAEGSYAYLRYAADKYHTALVSGTPAEIANAKSVLEDAYNGYFVYINNAPPTLEKTWAEDYPLTAFQTLLDEYQTDVNRQVLLTPYYAFFNAFRLDHEAQTDLDTNDFERYSVQGLKDEVAAVKEKYEAALLLNNGTGDTPPGYGAGFVPPADLAKWKAYYGVDSAYTEVGNDSLLMGIYLIAIQSIINMDVSGNPTLEISEDPGSPFYWDKLLDTNTGEVYQGPNDSANVVYNLEWLSLVTLLKNNYSAYYGGLTTTPGKEKYDYLLNLYRAMNGMFDSYYPMHWENVNDVEGAPVVYPVRELKPGSSIVLQIPKTDPVDMKNPAYDTFVVKPEHVENLINKLDTLLSSEWIKTVMDTLDINLGGSSPSGGLQGMPPGNKLPDPDFHMPDLDGDILMSLGEMRYSDKALEITEHYSGITIVIPPLTTARDTDREIDAITGDTAIRKWIQSYRADVLLYLLYTIFSAVETENTQGWEMISWLLKLLLEKDAPATPGSEMTVNGAPAADYYANLEPPAEMQSLTQQAMLQAIEAVQVDLSAAVRPFLTELLGGLVADNLYTNMLPNTVLGLYKMVCDLVWGIFEKPIISDMMAGQSDILQRIVVNGLGLTSVNSMLTSELFWPLLEALNVPKKPGSISYEPAATSLLELLIGAEITPNDLVTKCWPDDWDTKWSGTTEKDAFRAKLNVIKSILSGIHPTMKFPTTGAGNYDRTGLDAWQWIELSDAEVTAIGGAGSHTAGHVGWSIKNDIDWGFDQLLPEDRREAFIDVMGFTMTGISFLLGTVFGATDLDVVFRMSGLPPLPDPQDPNHPLTTADQSNEKALKDWRYTIAGHGLKISDLFNKPTPPIADDEPWYNLAYWAWYGIQYAAYLVAIAAWSVVDLIPAIPIQEWVGAQNHDQTIGGSIGGIKWPYWKGKYDARAGIYASLTAANAYGKVMIPLYEMLGMDPILIPYTEKQFNTVIAGNLASGGGVAKIVEGLNGNSFDSAFIAAKGRLQTAARTVLSAVVEPLLNWIDPPNTAAGNDLVPYSLGFRPVGKVLDLLPNLAYVVERGIIPRLVNDILDLNLSVEMCLGGLKTSTIQGLISGLLSGDLLEEATSNLISLPSGFPSWLTDALNTASSVLIGVTGNILGWIVNAIIGMIPGDPDLGTFIGFFAGNGSTYEPFPGGFLTMDIGGMLPAGFTNVATLADQFLKYDKLGTAYYFGPGNDKSNACKDCSSVPDGPNEFSENNVYVTHAAGLVGYLDHMIGIDLTGDLKTIVNGALGMIGLNKMLDKKVNPTEPVVLENEADMLWLIDTVVGKKEHITAFLVELFNPQTYPNRTFMIYPMVDEARKAAGGSLNEVNYSDIWTAEKANYLNNHLMELLDKWWDFLFAEPFLPWLWAKLGDLLPFNLQNLYTRPNLDAILKLLADMLSKLDLNQLLGSEMIQKLLPIINGAQKLIDTDEVFLMLDSLKYLDKTAAEIDAEFPGTDSYTEAYRTLLKARVKALNVKFADGDREAFSGALYGLLAPLAPILRVFLTGGRKTDAKGNLIETIWQGELYPNYGAKDLGYYTPGNWDKTDPFNYVYNTKRYIELNGDTTGDSQYRDPRDPAGAWVTQTGKKSSESNYVVGAVVPNAWAKLNITAFDPKSTELEPIFNYPVGGTFYTVGAEGDNITLIEDFLGFSGYDGYRQGLIPIYEHLGVPKEDIPTFQQFVLRATEGIDPDGLANSGDELAGNVMLFKMLVDPLLNLVDRVVADPINTIFDILPNLLYFLTAEATAADQAYADGKYDGTYDVLDGTTCLNECLNRLLRPIYALLDMLAPLVDLNQVFTQLLPVFGMKLPDDPGETFYFKDGSLPIVLNIEALGGPIEISLPIEISINDIVSGLLDSLLGDMLGDLGLTITLTDLTTLICGELETYKSQNGQDDAVRLNGNLPDLLTNIIRRLIELVFNGEDNYNALLGLIGGMGIPDAILPVLEKLLANIYGLMSDNTLKGHIGADLVLSMLFYLFYDANSLADQLLWTRDDYSSRIISFFEIIASSSSPTLRRYAERARRFLNMFYSDVVNPDDGLQGSGFIKFITDFWARIVAFFKSIGTWFTSLFKWLFPF